MSTALRDRTADRSANAALVADTRWRMISRTGEYALRVALHLGRLDAGARINAQDAAEALDVPAKYMARVLNALAHAGVVTSARGAHGGFRLAIPAAELTLAEVVAPFDAVGDAPQCLLRDQLCDHCAPCFAHQEWQHVAGHVRDFFRNTTIADLLDPARQPAVAAGLPSREEP